MVNITGRRETCEACGGKQTILCYVVQDEKNPILHYKYDGIDKKGRYFIYSYKMRWMDEVRGEVRTIKKRVYLTPKSITCDHCKGKGRINIIACYACGGLKAYMQWFPLPKWIDVPDRGSCGYWQMAECSTCQGTGEIIQPPQCNICNGYGEYKVIINNEHQIRRCEACQK